MRRTQGDCILQRIEAAEEMVIKCCGIGHFERSMLFFEQGCTWAEDNSAGAGEALALQTSPEFWAWLSIEWMKKEEELLGRVHYSEHHKCYLLVLREQREPLCGSGAAPVVWCTNIVAFKGSEIRQGYTMEMCLHARGLRPNRAIFEMITQHGKKK